MRGAVDPTFRDDILGGRNSSCSGELLLLPGGVLKGECLSVRCTGVLTPKFENAESVLFGGTVGLGPGGLGGSAFGEFRARGEGSLCGASAAIGVPGALLENSSIVESGRFSLTGRAGGTGGACLV